MNLGPQQASNILSQERTKQLKDYCTDMRLRWAVVLLALSSLYKWEDPVIAMSLVLPMLGTSIVGIIVDSEP